MNVEITLQIVLLRPTPGVVFGLQEGSGNKYETVQKQVSLSNDLVFRFSVNVQGDRSKENLPGFSGSFVQGFKGNRFVYINIGTYAGQLNTPWSRRLKIPLMGITWEDIDSLSGNLILETNVPGTGKDGGPNCATVKPFEGWHSRNI